MAAANHRYRHKKRIPALAPLSLILEMGDTRMTRWMGFLIKPFSG